MTFIDGTLLVRERPRIFVVAWVAALCIRTKHHHAGYWLEELEHTAVFAQLGAPS